MGSAPSFMRNNPPVRESPPHPQIPKRVAGALRHNGLNTFPDFLLETDQLNKAAADTPNPAPLPWLQSPGDAEPSVLAPRGCVPSGCHYLSDGLWLSPKWRRGRSSCGQRGEAPGLWGCSEPAWSSGRAPGCVCWGAEAWGAPRLSQQPHPTHPSWPGSLASSAPRRGLCVQASCGRVHLTELLCGRCAQVQSPQVNLGVLTGDVQGGGVQTWARVRVALAGTPPHPPP